MTNSKSAYHKYLSSDKWKTIRAQRIAIDNNECVLCAKEAKHVHHRRYPKTWGEETVNDLVSLCNNCHKKHHHNSNSDLVVEVLLEFDGLVYLVEEINHEILKLKDMFPPDIELTEENKRSIISGAACILEHGSMVKIGSTSIEAAKATKDFTERCFDHSVIYYAVKDIIGEK